MSTAPNASPVSTAAAMARNPAGDGTAPNTSMSAKNSTALTSMRTATERMTPSAICCGRSGAACMPEKVGFHL